MLKKLKLKQADEYDHQVATLYATEALNAYLGGSKHCERFGHEQGDIKEWDDVVLHGLNGKTVHCQIKRQMQDFSSYKIIRATKVQGKYKGHLQDLSTLDKAFESLAKYFGDPKYKVNGKVFWLAIPYPQIKIKEEITLTDLKDVCTEWKKAGATLEAFSGAQDKTSKIKEWLKNWCGFPSDESIYNCIQCLEIQNYGDEAAIAERCNMHLYHWYDDLDNVKNKIRTFLTDNSSSNQSITPRMLANCVGSNLKPQCRSWTSYEKKSKLDWTISGTLSGHANEIEPPLSVVDKLWGPVSNHNFELQFKQSSSNNSFCTLDLSLIRLALHSPNTVKILHSDASAWRTNVSNAIRHTLGTTSNDLSRITILDQISPPSPSEYRQLSSNSEIRSEQSTLTRSMDELTWNQIKTSVDDFVAELKEGEVQNLTESVWLNWKQEIDKDQQLQNQVTADMLYAAAEGEQSIGQLRAGPHTVHLIRDAFKLLLYIAIGLDAETMGWQEFCSNFSIRSIALAYWAGPRSSASEPRRFFDEDLRDERSELLGKEISKILVLPQTAASTSSIFGYSLASSEDEGETMADARIPQSVITRSLEFSDAIENNSVADIKSFVQGLITKRHNQRERQIASLIKG
ncbi:ABC-three component system protein [Vibrio splendidus]